VKRKNLKITRIEKKPAKPGFKKTQIFFEEFTKIACGRGKTVV
jgi:hypothetical protein